MQHTKRTTNAQWINITRPSSRRGYGEPERLRIGNPNDGPYVTIVRQNDGVYELKITTAFEDFCGGTHSVAFVEGCQKAKRIGERLYAALVNAEAPDHQGDSYDSI
jgi:hypothetical protein